MPPWHYREGRPCSHLYPMFLEIIWPWRQVWLSPQMVGLSGSTAQRAQQGRSGAPCVEERYILTLDL
jgi:hypothetical protein